VYYENLLFEVEEVENLDASYNNEPLRFKTLSDIIGPIVPLGQVPRELSTSESDQLFAISAEEPASVVEAT
jgi:hypothetical protein